MYPVLKVQFCFFLLIRNIVDPQLGCECEVPGHWDDIIVALRELMAQWGKAGAITGQEAHRSDPHFSLCLSQAENPTKPVVMYGWEWKLGELMSETT